MKGKKNGSKKFYELQLRVQLSTKLNCFDIFFVLFKFLKIKHLLFI